MKTSVRIRQPDDFHRHLRRGELLVVLLNHLSSFRRALVMPNAQGDIKDAQDVITYRDEILNSLPTGSVFSPLMSIKLTTGTTPETILNASTVGTVAAKYYPPQLTTNSGNGIPADVFMNRDDLFEALQQKNMLLLLHGEHDKSARCLDREDDFLKVLKTIALRFPKLRIVMEHITTAHSVEAVTSLPGNVAATITPHHLRITLNDVIGGNLHPHNFCKPLAKWEEDRVALVEAATSGNPKFFLGTDDAAHRKGNKECAEGCAGVWTGSYGLGHYTDVFEQAGALDKLENFASVFGARFYELPINEGYVELVRQPLTIPPELDGLVPFMAGQPLNWQVAK